MHTRAGPPGVRARPRLLSRALLAVFGASLGGIASFHLLLSVAPLYAASGGAGAAGAGLTTGALLLCTVAAELVSPRLVARFGYRRVFGAGLVLMGAPTVALTASAHLAAVVAVSAVRGLGFGLVVVLGSTLVASVVPPERRGEGLGLLGVVIGVPGVLALPFGIYLVGAVGFTPVFVAAAVAALAGLAAAPGLPGRTRHPTGRARQVGIVAGLRTRALVRPAVVFAATAMACGVVVTFLPLAVPAASSSLVALALFALFGVAMIARWWAGWYGDRSDPARLLVPSLLAATAGTLLLVMTSNPAALLVAMVTFGAGFGVMQNASLALMFRRVETSGYAMVGALWNLAFDAAMGLGAVGFGLMVTHTGYPAGFAITGAVMLVALVPAMRDHRARS